MEPQPVAVTLVRMRLSESGSVFHASSTPSRILSLLVNNFLTRSGATHWAVEIRGNLYELVQEGYASKINIHTNWRKTSAQRQILDHIYLGTCTYDDHSIERVACEANKLNVPYAVTSANCQHFVLSFCRDIKTTFEAGVIGKLMLASYTVMMTGWLVLLLLFGALLLWPPFAGIDLLRCLIAWTRSVDAQITVSPSFQTSIYFGILCVYAPILDIVLWLFFGRPQKIEVHNSNLETSSILRAMVQILAVLPYVILMFFFASTKDLLCAKRASSYNRTSHITSKTGRHADDFIQRPLPFVTLDRRSIVILAKERLCQVVRRIVGGPKEASRCRLS